MQRFTFEVYGLFSATVSALKHSLTGTHSIQLTYNTTQHRDDVPSQPDLGHGRSGSTEHRRGAQGWARQGPACQQASPWASRVAQTLMVMKGSACWPPATAAAPRAGWLCCGAQLAPMSESGTCQREQAGLSTMPSTTMMVSKDSITWSQHWVASLPTLQRRRGVDAAAHAEGSCSARARSRSAAPTRSRHALPWWPCRRQLRHGSRQLCETDRATSAVGPHP